MFDFANSCGYQLLKDIHLIWFPGFEAGGQATPSDIDPWFILGDETLLVLSTDRSSCFERNKVALRMEVFCGSKGSVTCPAGGVGVYNPGFWGMVNI